MKKIYIDISMLMIGTNFTGIPRVVMELVKRLNKSSDFELIFLEYDQKSDDFRIIDTDLFALFCETKQGNRERMRTRHHVAFTQLDENAVFFDMDTVWKTRVRRSMLYPVLKEKGLRIYPFIQDIIGVTHPQFCPQDDMLCFLDFVGASLLYADKILVTSNTTKGYIDALCEDLNVEKKEIRIVPLGGDFGVHQDKKDGHVSEEIKKIATMGHYLLMVGTVDPRKNHKLLLNAYDAGLKELGVNLVIAGYRGWNVDALFERMESHEDYGRGIFYINGASDEEISYLYEHCYALAYPSYIEGYGLPLMESFVRGVPVLAADTAINMEIGQDYAMYFEQDHPEELVKKVKALLECPETYRALKDKTKEFVPPTWEMTAEGIGRELKS